MKILLPAFILLASLAANAQSLAANAQWVKQSVDTTAAFRGLSVVNDKIVWASGTGGTVIRTIDGGKKWDVIQVPDAAKLDFRDIEAFDARTAYVLSIGNGESSRIYKTTDGGRTWNLHFKNTDEKAFFDALACWDKDRCVAMSDPVGGKFILKGWNPYLQRGAVLDPVFVMPKALEAEAAFAASGTCLIAPKFGRLFMVSGGNASRVFISRDEGRTWSVVDTPMVKGTAGSGIFSVAMSDYDNGVIVGGNYEKPNEAKDNLAFTTDGGKTWKLGTGLTGYRSAVAYIDKRTLIAVGTNGTDISLDGGKTWAKAGSEDLNSVQSRGKFATWAVGPKGGVYRLK